MAIIEGVGAGLGAYIRSHRPPGEYAPYDITIGPESIPTMGDILTIPLKAGIGYGLMRSAYWGAKAVGLTPFSRIRDPFNPQRLIDKYKSKLFKTASEQVKGRMDDISLGRFVKSDTAILRGKLVKGDFVKGDRRLFKRQYWTAAYDDVVERWAINRSTALDKYLLRNNAVYNRMLEISPDLAGIVGEDRVNQILREELYKANKLSKRDIVRARETGTYAPSRKGIIKGTDRLSKKKYAATFKTLSDAKLGQIPIEELLEAHPEFSRATREQFLLFKRQQNVSLWDFIRGSEEKRLAKLSEEGYLKTRYTAIKEGTIRLGRPAAPRSDTFKFTMWHRRGRKIRLSGFRTEVAFQKTLDRLTTEAIKGADRSAAAAAIQSYAEVGKHRASIATELNDMISSKLRPLRAVKLLGTMAFIAGVAAAAGTVAARTAAEVPGRIAATTRQLFRQEFGGGTILDNARTATERQRAIQAIQNSHMNARYLLGSEAVMYH